MDPILFWNEAALEANRVNFTGAVNEQGGPTLSSRALAIVHLAFAAVSGNPRFRRICRIFRLFLPDQRL